MSDRWTPPGAPGGALRDEEQPQRWTPSGEPGTAGGDPAERARNHPRFPDLVEAIRSNDNDRVRVIQGEIERDTGVGAWALQTLAQRQVEGVEAIDLPEGPTDDEERYARREGRIPTAGEVLSVAGRTAAAVPGNVFTAVMGAFEPLQLAGDAQRTFTANLADVQGERVTREQESGARIEPTDVREGTFSGDPARTPWQAASEMTQAAGRTAEQLLGDGGWVAYSPTLYWNGRRVWGKTPYEHGAAVTGEQFNERFENTPLTAPARALEGALVNRFGLDEDEARTWGGLASEVLYDPWLFGDFMFAGARIWSGVGKGVSRVAGRSMAGQRASQSIGQQAARFEGVAHEVYRTLSPLGMAQDAGYIARNFPGSPVDTVIRAVDNTVNRVLDIEMPAFFHRAGVTSAGLPGGEVTARTLGFEEGALRPKLRDLLFQGGTPAYFSRPKGRPEALTGGASYGPSIGDVAYGTQQQLNTIAMRGAEGVQDALTSGLAERRNVSIAGLRIAVPGARVVPEAKRGYVRGVGQLVSEFVDSVGMTQGKVPSSYQRRLADLSGVYGEDIADTMARFQRAVSATRQVVYQTGHAVSGYPEFTTAMRRAAAELDVDYFDIRRAYEQHVGGVDIQAMEAADFFPTHPARVAGGAAPDADDLSRARGLRQGFENEPEVLRMWEDEVQRQLKLMGRDGLALLTPRQYLEGFREGYLRRMFGGVEHAQENLRALGRRDIVMIRDMDAPELAQRFGDQFGREAAPALEQFFNAVTPDLPRGFTPAEGQTVRHSATLRTDDVATILSRETRRTVTPEQVADLVYGNDTDYQYLKETIHAITDYTARSRTGTGAGGAPMARPTASFQARNIDLTPEQLIARLQLFDPVTQVAEVGLRGGRAVRSSHFLGEAADALRDLGLVVTRSDLEQQLARGNSPGTAKRALDAMDDGDRMFAFLNDAGEKYVVIPKSKQAWGPLAGMAVPEDVARLTAYATNFTRGDSGSYQRLLSMWRRGLLAPLSTSLRNVGGNFILMAQAGANFPDMVQNLPRAHRIRREFLETGRLPGEFRGYEPMFSFVRESTRTRQATRSIEAQLEGLSRSRNINASTFLDHLDAAVDTASYVPPLGFLGLFRYGEEVTRVSSFLTQYDTLIRAGSSVDDAARRAAHFAANAGYNYGALPLLPDVLKRTGLAAFPQFAYFTAARTFRAGMERPAVPRTLEYGRQAANMMLAGADKEEHERITAMSADWLQASQPLAIPFPLRDGSYAVFNSDFWVPQGANFAETIMEPVTMGWLAPIADLYYAHLDGSGTSARTARYGKRVFDPASGPAGRALQSAAYVGSQMVLPGLWRTAGQIGDAVDYNIGWENVPGVLRGEQPLTAEVFTQNKDVMDELAYDQARYFNSEWAQLIGRLTGVGTQKVDVRGDVSLEQRIKALQRQYGPALSSLSKQVDEAWRRGHREKAEELEARIVRLEDEWRQREDLLFEMTR